MRESVVRQCKMHNTPVPERFQNSPELFIGNELYYHAFLDLTSCRQVSETEGPISWRSVMEWAFVNKLTEEQTEDLLFFIPQMDSEYLKYKAKKLKDRDKK